MEVHKSNDSSFGYQAWIEKVCIALTHTHTHHTKNICAACHSAQILYCFSQFANDLLIFLTLNWTFDDCPH